MSVNRKLAAIMFTDIVGFTQMMGDSEDIAIDILGQQDNIFNPLLDSYNGNLLKKMGDGLLIEFPSAVQAVKCALKIQANIKKYNESAQNTFHIRIGIHLGDVLTLGDDVLGDGVNIASRIEPLATPDGICITEAVQQSIKSKVKVDARRVTEVDLKHIDDKYTLYKIPKEAAENYEAEQAAVGNTIDINSINDLTENKKEIAHMLKYLIWLAPLSAQVVMIFINIFIKGNNFSGYLDYLQSMQGLVEFLCSMFGSIILSLLLHKKHYKISFKDIRNVPLLLDLLILNMEYKVASQKGNNIEYLHRPKIEFWINFLKESRFYPKAIRNMDILSISFDGNTVAISGVKPHVNKLIKNIKKRNKNK